MGFEQIVSDVSKGRLTTQSHWLPAPMVDRLQRTFPGKPWHWIFWGIRAAVLAFPLLPALWVATLFDPRKFPNHYILVSNLQAQAPGWVVVAFLPLVLYLFRHVPVAGHYPDCGSCGREQETLLALLEDRTLCRRCGRSLRDRMDRMVPARRRAWSSL